MECCFFLVVIIIVIVSNLSKVTSNNSSDSSSANLDLDDIFKGVMNAKNQGGGSGGNLGYDNFPSTPLPSSRPRKKTKPKQVASSSNSLLTPTNHAGHSCDDVNYDNLPSLEGGTGSFNIASRATAKVYPRQQSEVKVKFGREDLVKSFIMSEVLQRYDINRIYSRIPSVKSDD